ncbi:gliding motility lipoprotein GldD [bacterium]|nr:gliding motility lipoprotein GldD [bacterium]
MMRPAVWIFLVGIGLSCRQQETNPLPYGHLRYALPDTSSVALAPGLPFGFQHNHTARWKEVEPNWGNLEYPSLRARIQFTYKSSSEANLEALFQEAQELAYRHSVKADGIEEQFFEHPERRVYALLYRMKGRAATSTQFYATDSSRHFLRGVLYFDAVPEPDSLRPADVFMTAEIRRLLETLEWVPAPEQ